MFIEKIYRFESTTEYEFTFSGKYGKKGEKRKRKDVTKEKQQEYNQRQRVKKMRRLLKANFHPGDYWCTLKYPAGTRKPIAEVQKDLAKFRRKLKNRFKKLGQELKYVYRIEVGERGGIHVHILLNKAEGLFDMVEECWEPGRANQEYMDEQGYQAIANYITKIPEGKAKEKLEEYTKEEQKLLLKTGSSKNLKRPEPEAKQYNRRTVERMLREGPKAKEGFIVDEDSIITYECAFTGYTHYEYTERKIGERKKNRTTRT